MSSPDATGRWRRLGLVAPATPAPSWAASHAALPVLAGGADGMYDLYFSARDGDGRARIAKARFTLGTRPAIEDVQHAPALDLGNLGTFDDRGVTTSCIVTTEDRTFLYYTGWMLGVTVPFYLAVGLAVSTDGGRTFQRVSQAPVLERNQIDPLLTASPFVMVENGIWRMWYVSGSTWTIVDGAPRHSYHIRYAESSDGIQWRRDGRVCVDNASAEEYAFARPCVRYDGHLYRMWYSYRGVRYRIGYAESTDGLAWTRKDRERGLDASGAGWDSEMVEYPWVFLQDGREYMLYNGDGYGRSGIGIAVWEPSS